MTKHIATFSTKVIFSFFLLLTLNGCIEEEPKEITTPDYTNPIIQNDDFFTGSHWNDPHVLIVGDQLIMYASSDKSWDEKVKIYRLISSDGINWSLNPSTPVLELTENAWDGQSIETPSVVFYQGNYHLFYTGYDVSYSYTTNGADNIPNNVDDDSASKHFKLGHAISSDGINFTKQGFIAEPTAPYSDMNFEFNQYIVGEPAAVVYNNKIYVYFTAVGVDATISSTWQVIGLTCFDGSTWDQSRLVLTPDLNIYPRNTFVGYSTPNAIVLNNKMHLYYDVVIDSPWTQVKLHHASSPNGETTWTQDATPLFEREDYSWTTDEIRSPAALKYKDKLYLYFAGHVMEPEINLAIGLEILPLPN